MKVAVLDTAKQPLAPCHPAMARKLLSRGEAAVFRRAPFTIILKREVSDVQTPDLRLKFDPGSKVTGIAIVNQQTGEVVIAAEIEHRGQAIKRSLDARRAVRRGRRNRKTRYREPRFSNRRRPEGWLPPSLESRVENVHTWALRLRRAYPIKGIAMELVKFDTQMMENPEIEGVEYQQGELAGYELREYLFLKFGQLCAYRRDSSPCDAHLEVEHIIPRSRGGSNRVSNLTIACHKHNQEKGDRTAAEYGFPKRIGSMRPASGKALPGRSRRPRSARCVSGRPATIQGRCAGWISMAFPAHRPKLFGELKVFEPAISSKPLCRMAQNKAFILARLR